MFAGMGVAELRRLRQLEEENRKLKQLVADLSLDKPFDKLRASEMLQDVIRKNSEACLSRRRSASACRWPMT
jgi:putative transposase